MQRTKEKGLIEEHLQRQLFKLILEVNLRRGGEEKPAAGRIRTTDALEV